MTQPEPIHRPLTEPPHPLIAAAVRRILARERKAEAVDVARFGSAI